MHEFLLDGVSCRRYGITISGEDTFSGAERDVEIIEIPGRSGTLTIDKHRFKNKDVPYPAFIRRNFQENARAARAWLNASAGYRRLEDNYHPDEFRLARYRSELDFRPWPQNVSGSVEIVFDCMPQRWLKSGEEAVELTAPGTLVNPTLFEALPIITLTGDGPGNLIVNGHVIEISDVGGSVTLNRETRRAYAGMTPRDYTMTGRFDWLGLRPGDNTISFNGGISAVSIIPRWWTI